MNEAALTRKEVGWGLTQWTNKDIALAGGFRSGNSPAGTTRLRYTIYDLAGFDPKNPDASDVGIVDLFVGDDQAIKGIVNIELKSKRAGIGRKVIQSLVDTVGELRVHDIQKKAVGFWTKMGVEFDSKSQKNGVIRRRS